LSDTSSESSEKKLPPVYTWDRVRVIIVGAAGGSIAMCVAFLSTLLTLGPNGLDAPLHVSLIAFSLALPVFVFTLALVFTFDALFLAYQALGSAFFLLAAGISAMLAHLDLAASWAFVGASILFMALTLATGWILRRYDVRVR
jgi:hypothetical protein